MKRSLYAPVKRQEKLSVQVADQLQDLILSKHLQVGDRLPPERQLCEQFDVSRTVIREAIQALEAKGLLVSQVGSGTYVKSIQSEDVANSIGLYISTSSTPVSHTKLMEVRRILEVQIAALAAVRATMASLDELEHLVDQMEAMVDDPEVFAQHDLDFHMALARATGNELLEILLDPFVDALYEGRRLASTLPGVPEEAVRLHRDIVRSIRARDVNAATEAMSTHLRQAHRVILQALERNA